MGFGRGQPACDGEALTVGAAISVSLATSSVLMPVSLPTAIEAMKNAHREEMERELEKSQRSQISSINSDIEALRRQYL